MPLPLPSWVASMSGPEVLVNENFEAVSGAAFLGTRRAATTGLTWAYYGGTWADIVIPDGAITCAASTVTYVVIVLNTGVIESSTATTGWNDNTNRCRIARIVTDATGITSIDDRRFGKRGAMGRP